jgi:hypothetical protein
MNRATLALAVLLAACGGTTEEGTEVTAEGGGTAGTEGGGGGEAAQEQPPPGPNPVEVCTNAMHKERECADAFVPALVDLRIRLDNPPGTAHAGRGRGRNRLLTQAHTEFQTDSTDERVTQTCGQFGQMPAAQTGPMVTMMQGCLAETDCAAFVACDMRVQELRLNAAGGASPGASGSTPAATGTTPPASGTTPGHAAHGH